MPDVYTCPSCDVQLRAHDTSDEFSLGRHLGMELVFWAVFVLALSVLWAFGIDSEILAFLVAFGVVMFVVRARMKRPHAIVATNPTRYFCPKCLRVFYRKQLRPTPVPTHANAP